MTNIVDGMTKNISSSNRLNSSSREESDHNLKIDQLSVFLITNSQELNSLKNEWQQLFAASDNLFFQSFEWFVSWWQVYGESAGYNLSLITVRHSETKDLLLLWPLVIKKRGLCRVGMWPCQDLGQYGDILVDKNLVDKVCFEAAWNEIQKLKIDLLYLTQVRKNAKVHPFLRQKMACDSESEVCCITDFNGFDTWDDYRLSLSKNFRKRQGRLLRNFSKSGDLQFEVVTDYSEIRKTIDAILRLKREWLAETGNYGRILEQSEASRWLNDIAIQAHEKGNLNLTVLRLNNKIVAGQIAFLSHNELHANIGAYDIQYRSYGIGRIQTEDAMRWCFDNGYRFFDFMPPYDDYKNRWSNLSVDVRTFICPLTLSGKIHQVFFSEKFRRKLKYFYRLIPRFVKKRLVN